jgi:hypothetical protein
MNLLQSIQELDIEDQKYALISICEALWQKQVAEIVMTIAGNKNNDIIRPHVVTILCTNNTTQQEEAMRTLNEYRNKRSIAIDEYINKVRSLHRRLLETLSQQKDKKEIPLIENKIEKVYS